MITTGTDTLEELAVLCSLLYAGGPEDPPVVLTGANRPASNPGADGPANLLGAIALAGSAQASGLGVVVAFGAGHLSPAMARALRAATERIPALLTCRPERSQMLFSTYGFEGAERDLRASGAVCVPFPSPVAARIALLCCLGAGLAGDALATALAPFDARLR